MDENEESPFEPNEVHDFVPQELHEANRRSWNLATVAHNSHKLDQAGHLKGGGCVLFPEELELLGELAGQRLLHLQCNAGQDSLCLARRGAQVIGVDISDDAIAFAKQLSADSGIAAEFERADIYDWFATARAAGRRFERIFCSYGALNWLSDLKTWASSIAELLVPGGRLVVVEYHPAFYAVDEYYRFRYPYFGDGSALRWDEGVGDYVALSGSRLAPSGFEKGAQEFENSEICYEFQWSLGQILQTIIGAGLTLQRFEEYPYSNGWKPFKDMREEDGRRLYAPQGYANIPMMYGLVAGK